MQALVLATEGEAASGLLGAAVDAVDDLEAVVLGRRQSLRLDRVEVRPIVEDTVKRWLFGSALEGEPATVELRWRAGAARAIVDPRRISQAVDNLIANALEHGGTPVIVDGARGGSGLRLSVANPLASRDSVTLPLDPPPGGPSDRGHGLRIVSAIAAEAGGRFLFDCSGGWAVGTLELPLAADQEIVASS